MNLDREISAAQARIGHYYINRVVGQKLRRQRERMAAAGLTKTGGDGVGPSIAAAANQEK